MVKAWRVLVRSYSKGVTVQGCSPAWGRLPFQAHWACLLVCSFNFCAAGFGFLDLKDWGPHTLGSACYSLLCGFLWKIVSLGQWKSVCGCVGCPLKTYSVKSGSIQHSIPFSELKSIFVETLIVPVRSLSISYDLSETKYLSTVLWIHREALQRQWFTLESSKQSGASKMAQWGRAPAISPMPCS